MVLHTAPRAGEVHLWSAPLDVSPQLAERFAATLSPDERERAARLHGDTDRARYVAAHGWLRELLSRYLDAPPVVPRFAAGEHGKPRLTNPPVSWLRFNLAHSAAMAVFAVARDRDVGVDLERVRNDVDVEGVAQRFFTARQRTALAELSGAERAAAFFSMWTRNEAYVKATGTGLAGAGSDLDTPTGYMVAEFGTAPGYAAAVAVQGEGAEIPGFAADLSEVIALA